MRGRDTGPTSEASEIVLPCPAVGERGTRVERVPPFDVHVVLEKPIAAALPEADRPVDGMATDDQELVVDCPLARDDSHRTTERLID